MTFGQKIIERLKRFFRPKADNPVTRNAERFAQLAEHMRAAQLRMGTNVAEDIDRKFAEVPSEVTKPCPFCGAQPFRFSMLVNTNKWHTSIMCNNEDCPIDQLSVDQIQHVEKEAELDWSELERAWNTRFDRLKKNAREIVRRIENEDIVK